MTTRTLAAFALSTAALVLLLPGALAGHGGGWTATGTATLLGAHDFEAKARFTGLQLANVGTLRLEFREPGVPVPVHQNDVQVRLQFLNVFFIAEEGCAAVEVVPMVMDSVVPGELRLAGFTRTNLCTGVTTGVFDGPYLAATVQLHLDVFCALC